MAIGRHTWTDDDGSGATGTVLVNARLQEIYDDIDAAIGGIGQLDLGTLSNNQIVGLTIAGSTTPEAAILVMTNQVAGGWIVGDWLMLRGSNAPPAVYVMGGGSGSFTTAPATGNRINVYWSAGNSRFELENKSGGNLPTKILYYKQ